MGSERRLAAPAARQPDALLGWMESLADPTRLRLLRLLERHELGVAELCDVLQLPQSTVSRHLKILADQAWLRSRALRTTNLYRMDLAEVDPAARRLWTLTREQTDDWATIAQDQLRLTRRLAERQPSQGFFAGAAGRWDRLRRTGLLAIPPWRKCVDRAVVERAGANSSAGQPTSARRSDQCTRRKPECEQYRHTGSGSDAHCGPAAECTGQSSRRFSERKRSAGAG